jgi:membrane fusion protein (multidrug efflux system)
VTAVASGPTERSGADAVHSGPVTSRLRSRAALLGLAACLAAAAGCRPAEPGATAEVEATSPGADFAIPVETAIVRRGSVVQRISAPGSILARRESRIGTEVSGRIERIFVHEGDRVEAGDPLFQIDPEPYQLALHQAEARLDRARAERGQLEADLRRAQTLHKENVLAQQRLDELTTKLAVAKAAEREAKEQLALARRNLDNTLVRSPYTASVAARLEDEGTTALVQPQTVVIVLQETAELEAQATIPEVHFSAIHAGDPALLHIEGLANPIATEVESVSDVIDPATRTYLVKMKVPNPDHRLKAGVFARVEILPRAKDDVVVVPLDAVRREDGRTEVLVLRDGRAEAVPVRLGIVAEDVAEVLRGVRVDDVVLVGERARTLGPGMRVRPAASSDADEGAGGGSAAPAGAAAPDDAP